MSTNKTERIYQSARQNAKEHSLLEKIPALGRMLKAWRQGQYKPRKRNFVFALFLIIYVISPLDFIPEGLFGLFGLVDDIAMIGYAFTRIMKELDRFLDWEQSQNPRNTIDTDAEVIQ